MRLCALAALLCAACFSPTPPAGAPCVNDNDCPSSQTCIANHCGGMEGPTVDSLAMGGDAGPTIDGPPDDVDADGVKNMVDNCPSMSNADQHDEDVDLVGDVCDNCPHIKNATQVNGDNDGVGDACDPRPAQNGDTIALFIPFHVLPAGVSATLGNWTIQNDAYRSGSFNDSEFIVAGNRDKIVVEIGGAVEQVQGETWIAVSVGEHGMPAKFHDCGYLDIPASGGNPADNHNGIIEYYDGQNFDLRAGNHMLNNRLSGAFTIRVGANSVTNQVTCTTIDSRTTANTSDGQATTLEAGTVGVKSYGATYLVNYLIVYGQP